MQKLTKERKVAKITKLKKLIMEEEKTAPEETPEEETSDDE